MIESPGYIPRDVPPIGNRLTIVCGPPRAGKNTYIDARCGVDDIVIDLDEIRATGLSIPDAYAERDRQLTRAADSHLNVWLIICAPLAWQRRELRARLKPRELVVVATDPHTCHARADDDEIASAAVRWWSAYTSDPADTVVRCGS